MIENRRQRHWAITEIKYIYIFKGLEGIFQLYIPENRWAFPKLFQDAIKQYALDHNVHKRIQGFFVTQINNEVRFKTNAMLTTENILDVTILPPREKHPTIFRRFDELKEGEALTITNDHDPKPLYYQMINERGPVFVWEYLENGPEWWRVRITRQNKRNDEPTVGQLAASDFRKASVFKKYGIDFCCGGKKTLQQSCSEKNLNLEEVEKALNDVASSREPKNAAFNQWSADFLADYIVNTHHTYVKSTLPDMREYAAKVAAVHGHEHDELIRVAELIEELDTELSEHMMKEERILFPYVKLLVQAKKEKARPAAPHFGSVKNPIQMMEMEHDIAGNIVHEIRELTANYSLPENACTSYSLLFKMLEDFEEDLHVHIHLENNILFPKAAALEAENSVN